MTSKHKRRRGVRVYLPAGILLVGFAVIEFRLVQLQLLQHERFKAIAQQEQVRVIKTSPERGRIYDRSSFLLATNITSYSLYACPDKITQPQLIAAQIAPIIEEPSADSLCKKLDGSGTFVWLRRKLTLQQKQQIDTLQLPGLGFIQEAKRLYSEGELAGHLLGGVGIDNQGLAGLEYFYDQPLQGEAGKIVLKRDALGAYIPFTTDVIEELVPGFSLHLTIDARVQAIVEQELARGLAATSARSVEAIFMNPDTGAVLALANKPGHNPNEWRNYSYYERTNRIVQHIYEPGSTFKVITSATLLEEDLIHPEDRIFCNAAIQFGDHTITDWKPFNAEMNFREIIYNSSDVGMIKAAQRMDKDTFHKHIISFGFGAKTGIDHPGEASGIVKSPRKWYLTDFPCISIGQGIAVTPLQMVAALSAIVNGGYLLRPFLVEQVCDLDGTTVLSQGRLVRDQVVSEQTSSQMREMLGSVVSRGTGKAAQIKGYTAGGKTGTAQIPSPGGGYLPGKYVASFIGFAPVGKPQLAGIVLVKEPTGAYYGGEVAAPIFGRIVQRIMPLLGILPQGEVLSAGANNTYGTRSVTVQY